MTLEDLLCTMAVWGPVAIVDERYMALGAAPAVYYSDESTIGEVDSDLMGLEVAGINARSGDDLDGVATLEIALYFED